MYMSPPGIFRVHSWLGNTLCPGHQNGTCYLADTFCVSTLVLFLLLRKSHQFRRRLSTSRWNVQYPASTGRITFDSSLPTNMKAGTFSPKLLQPLSAISCIAWVICCCIRLKITYSNINALWHSDAIWWHWSESTLARIMACCLAAPRHRLNQCGLILSEVLWQSNEGRFHKGYLSH